MTPSLMNSPAPSFRKHGKFSSCHIGVKIIFLSFQKDLSGKKASLSPRVSIPHFFPDFLTESRLGYLFMFDHLVDTTPSNDLCFRPLDPLLETKIYVIWKKYHVFSPIAEMLLDELKVRLTAH